MKKTLGNRSGNRRAAAMLTASFLTSPVIVRADAFTWNGSSTSGSALFSQPDNWAGNAAPPNDGTADVTFGSLNTRGFRPNLSEFSLNSINFNSSAQAFNIGGGLVTIGAGGIVDSSPTSENLSLNFTLSKSQTWNVAAGTLTFGGGMPPNQSLVDVVRIGNGALNLTPDGTFFVGALSIIGGTTQVSSGSLISTSSVTHGILLSGGARLYVNGGDVDGRAAINGWSTFTDDVVIDGGSSVVVTGGQFSAGADGGDIAVGGVTGGSLQILNVGVSYSTALFVGAGFATGRGSGSVLISGSGAFVNTGEVDFGYNDSTGTVTVTNSARVNTSATEFFSRNGFLNISGGTFNTYSLISQSGYGSITLSDPSGGYGLNINNPYPGDVQLYTGSITGTGSLAKSGSRTTQILGGEDTFTGRILVSSGTLILTGTNRLGAMNISGGTVQVTGAENVLSLSGLTIKIGTLDLTTDSADISSGALSAITSLIQVGYNNGAWNGSGGITSSTATTDSSHLTALGVIQNNQDGSAIYTSSNKFHLTNPAPGDILIAYTYYGDSNLDGKVDGSDYTKIDNGYLTRTTGWFNGDFNYDGVVNGSDYTLIDNAFNSQGAALTSRFADPSGSIATYISGNASVPEPATLFILGIVSLWRLARRGH